MPNSGAEPASTIPMQEPLTPLRLLRSTAAVDTYLARIVDVELASVYGERVAIKVPKDIHGARRLRQFVFQHTVELERLAAVTTSHANLLRYLGFVLFRGRLVLVVEPFGAENLRDRMGTPMPDHDTAIQVACDVLSALEALHARDLVHGVLTPAHVLFHDRVIKVDAAVLPAALELAGEDLRYAAPEVILGDSPQPSADVWSLGIILYELATGRWPFGDPPQNREALLAYRTAGAAPRFDSDPPLAPLLQQALRRALAWKPEERYAGAAAMRQALLALEPRTLPVPKRKKAEPGAVVVATPPVAPESPVPALVAGVDTAVVESTLEALGHSFEALLGRYARFIQRLENAGSQHTGDLRALLERTQTASAEAQELLRLLETGIRAATRAPDPPSS
ncbi:MAG: protein kinase [Anaerolineae bacterium]|nr:protein kinase [Anaerolineae bacterium]